MNKKYTIFLLIFIVVISLSGCSLSVQQIDSLMRPPMAQGNFHELQEVFYKTVGKDIILKSPKSGQYRSSFVMFDIDNDGKDEALVFYADRNDNSAARVNILSKADDSWYSIGDFIGAGSEVNSVVIVDMNGDKMPELIISWLINGNKNNKILSVYNCLSKADGFDVSVTHSELFTEMEPMDVDGDGENEIFVIYLDRTAEVPQAYAKALKVLGNGEVINLSQTKLDGNIVSYGKIKTEKISEGYPMRIYVDANKGETQMITEIIYWDTEKNILIAPLLNPQTQSNILTLRNNRIPSADINSDGIIEIPTQMTMPGSRTLPNDNDSSGLLHITKWIQVRNDGNAVEVFKSVINASEGYMLTIPKNLDGRFTIISFNTEKQWDVCVFSSAENFVGDILFSIISIDRKDWDGNSSVYAGYYPIIYATVNVIAVRVDNAGAIDGLNIDFVKQNLFAYKAE